MTSLATHAVTSKQWIDKQWAEIPIKVQVAKPSPLFNISAIDKKMLASSVDPLVRNTYINHTYSLLGDSLSRCIGLDQTFGNWYYFASWASKSAGEIISGRKFKQLSPWQDFWVSVLQLAKVLQPQQELQSLFGSVNQMIAAEMIPLGKTFLEFFCQGTPRPWKDFRELMFNKTYEDKILQAAFFNYYQAIFAQSINLKKEHTILASTWQVISEQKRIDNPIKSVFDAQGPTPLKKIIQRKCTDIGDYHMESSNTFTTIVLNQDIIKKNIDHDLKKIDLPALKKLYKEEHTMDFKEAPSINGTACQNWGSFPQRKKFLTAMFWVYINKVELLSTPEKSFSHIKTFSKWEETLLQQK